MRTLLALASLLTAGVTLLAAGAAHAAPGPKPRAGIPKLPARFEVVSKGALKGGARPSDYGLTGENKGGDDPLALRLRTSLPAAAPAFATAPLEVADRPFHAVIADPLPDGGWMTFYRHNPAGGLSYVGADFLVVVRDDDGRERHRVPLDPLLLTPETEVQDVRLRGDLLVFNEACGTYSRNYRRKCSTLVGYDLGQRRVLWRTPWLTSNNQFLFWDDRTIVTGYGFTAEPDHLYLVDARSGRLLGRAKLDSAHSYLERMGDELHVITYGSHFVMRVTP